MATFATRIKELRVKRGWTQKELAAKLQLSAQTVSLWERGARKPDWSAQIDLQRVFEIGLGYISGASDDPEPVKTPTEDDLERSMIEDDDAILRMMAVRMCQLSGEMREVVKAVIRQAYRLDKENDRLLPEEDHQVQVISKVLLNK